MDDIKETTRNLKTIVIDKALPKPHRLLLLSGELKSYPYKNDAEWWALRLYTRIN